MSYYRTCPNCGANLDPGEHCKCQEQKEIEPKSADMELASEIIRLGKQLGKLSSNHAVNIRLYTDGSGYVSIDMGDYSFTQFSDGKTSLYYEPIGKVDEWMPVMIKDIKFEGRTIR